MANSEPIGALALQCGWRTPVALKRIFKKRFGVSMREFRKQAGKE